MFHGIYIKQASLRNFSAVLKSTDTTGNAETLPRINFWTSIFGHESVLQILDQLVDVYGIGHVVGLFNDYNFWRIRGEDDERFLSALFEKSLDMIEGAGDSDDYKNALGHTFNALQWLRNNGVLASLVNFEPKIPFLYGNDEKELLSVKSTIFWADIARDEIGAKEFLSEHVENDEDELTEDSKSEREVLENECFPLFELIQWYLTHPVIDLEPVVPTVRRPTYINPNPTRIPISVGDTVRYEGKTYTVAQTEVGTQTLTDTVTLQDKRTKQLIDVSTASVEYNETYTPTVGDVCWIKTYHLNHLKNGEYVPFPKFKLDYPSPPLVDNGLNDVAYNGSRINQHIAGVKTYTVLRFPGLITKVAHDGFNHMVVHFATTKGNITIKQKRMMADDDIITKQNTFQFKGPWSKLIEYIPTAKDTNEDVVVWPNVNFKWCRWKWEWGGIASRNYILGQRTISEFGYVYPRLKLETNYPLPTAADETMYYCIHEDGKEVVLSSYQLGMQNSKLMFRKKMKDLDENAMLVPLLDFRRSYKQITDFLRDTREMWENDRNAALIDMEAQELIQSWVYFNDKDSTNLHDFDTAEMCENYFLPVQFGNRLGQGRYQWEQKIWSAIDVVKYISQHNKPIKENVKFGYKWYSRDDQKYNFKKRSFVNQNAFNHIRIMSKKEIKEHNDRFFKEYPSYFRLKEKKPVEINVSALLKKQSLQLQIHQTEMQIRIKENNLNRKRKDNEEELPKALKDQIEKDVVQLRKKLKKLGSEMVELNKNMKRKRSDSYDGPGSSTRDFKTSRKQLKDLKL